MLAIVNRQNTALRIQFLSFEGCPLAAAARIELEAALANCGLEEYEEIDILGPSAGWTARRGTPTILLNGADITGRPKGDRVSCRIYPGSEGVPDRAEIEASIREKAAG